MIDGYIRQMQLLVHKVRKRIKCGGNREISNDNKASRITVLKSLQLRTECETEKLSIQAYKN
jgi:hypothetical protein